MPGKIPDNLGPALKAEASVSGNADGPYAPAGSSAPTGQLRPVPPRPQ